MAEKRSTTRLTMRREEARQRLQERIGLAKEIVPNGIQSGEDLANAEEREKKWRNYNIELLSRMFTTEEYSNEHSYTRIHIHQITDQYNDPSLGTFIRRINESVRRQRSNLESIIERLELIDDSSADRAGTTTPRQDRSKVFVVHGHDEGVLQAMARFLRDDWVTGHCSPRAGGSRPNYHGEIRSLR
jgi:flagellar biosynthesis regulator FlaF